MKRPERGKPLRNFSEEVRHALQQADQRALRYNHDHLGSEHLLAALVCDGGGPVVHLLYEMGVPPREIAVQLRNRMAPGVGMQTGARLVRTPCLMRAIEHAEAAAKELGDGQVTVHALLLGLATCNGVAAEVLRDTGFDPEKLRTRFGRPMPMCHASGDHGPAGNGSDAPAVRERV